MGMLRDRMIADMKIVGYSAGTRRIYVHHARQFVAYFRRSPTELGADEVRRFLLHLVEERGVSRVMVRQARSALRFLYTVTLNLPLVIEWLPPPRNVKRLPVVISGTEVEALLTTVHAPMYRAILMVLYSAGLRVSEACRLRPEDIDSKRMVIWVRGGKGAADRCTVLSRRMLGYLRYYWRRCRPVGGWLFPGGLAGQPIGADAVRTVFRKAVAVAGLTKRVTPHSLRHAFATHLMDSGVDSMVIGAMLGHASPRATKVYMHLSTLHIARIASPLDLLGTPKAALLG